MRFDLCSAWKGPPSYPDCPRTRHRDVARAVTPARPGARVTRHHPFVDVLPGARAMFTVPMPPRRASLACQLLACLLTLAGCATIAPRFPPNIQAALARDSMRRLETRSLELYYPADRRAEALRVAARLEACVDRLRARAQGPRDGRLFVVLTSADFNNAYVSRMSPGRPQQMVLPEHVTLELFHWFQLGTGDVADIACHEAVHYVQLQQVGGIWGPLNALTGGVLPPNIYTESWFLEGLATYYEGRLGARVGRPSSPIFRGWWESGVASERSLDPGLLQPANRDVLPFGAAYQTGLAFVEWLAARHGEEKLWEYVESVGSGITLNLGLTLRFKSVFGQDIGDAFASFQEDLRRTLPARRRPPTQAVLAKDLGYAARLATSPKDGAMAVLSEGRGEVPTLRIYGRDGSLRLTRWLTPLLPPRPFIAVSPLLVSGMRFSPDGETLYALLGDVDEVGNTLGRLLALDARTGELRRQWVGLTGLGGDVTPDGRAYVFVQVEGDGANLVRLDLASGERTALTDFHGRASLAPPTVSPDGRRIAFARWDGGRFDLLLREEDGQVRLLTRDVAMDYAPRWVDAQRLVLLREVDGRAQVHLLDVEGGRPVPVTDAPFLAFDPGPLGDGRVAFLNREGWSWTLDAAPLPSVLATAPPATAALTEAGPGAGAPPDELHAEASFPPLTADEEAPVAVLGDTPYSHLDHLFLPQLHAPFIASVRPPADGQPLGVQYGLSLSGADRLSFHTWALNLTFDTQRRGPFISAGYGNSMLAPWFLSAVFSRAPLLDVTDWSLSVGGSRGFWTTPLSLSVFAFQRDVKAPRDGAVPGQLVGPRFGVAYFAGDATPDGGLQRGAGVDLRGALYTARFRAPGLGTAASTVGDARLELQGALPVPGLSNDSLTFSLLGRALPGAPEGLLRVGGVTSGYSNVDFDLPEGQAERPRSSLGPLGFAEPLRGYEDYQLSATRLGLASARYRVNLVLDRGWASFLYVLPSFFLRQVELDAFGTYAWTYGAAGTRQHRVGGGSVTLRTLLGGSSPVAVRYQLSLRADDGRGPLHLVSLSFE